ncbi:MAG: AMP-binding protein [Verrucomicrobiales bacterium]
MCCTGICAPINPDLREAEVAALIPETGVDVLVAHGLCAAEARKAAATLGLPVLEVDWDGHGGLRWSGSPLSEAPALTVAAGPHETALVLLTSGSSARPKRVPLTHLQLALSARRMAESVRLTSEDCCLNLMPMFHVGAVVDLLLAPLSVGGSVLRSAGMSAEEFFAALADGRPTWFQGVPTMLHELAAHAVKHPNKHKRKLRFIRAVSSPMPLDWLHEIQHALGSPLIEIYGMTETAGVITSNPLPPAKRKAGSVGMTTGLEVIVRNDSGSAAATMQCGEILVHGPGVMRGYEGLTEASAGTSAMTTDGWLCTGDEGYFDADGYLFITGRIGDQINRGGEKISPREIDEVLVSHPMVREAAAFAMTHVELGQEVAAAIVVEAGMSPSIDARSLTEHVAARLAYFKVPKNFYLLEELPRGPGGKLRRRLLPGIVRELPPLGNEPKSDWEAPATEMERLVAAWWETELRISAIGRTGHFFDLGGEPRAKSIPGGNHPAPSRFSPSPPGCHERMGRRAEERVFIARGPQHRGQRNPNLLVRPRKWRVRGIRQPGAARHAALCLEILVFVRR